MITKTFIAAATLVLVSSLVPAHAAAATSGGYEVSVATVQTADINLSSPEGKSALKARIASAVNKVCGVSSGSIDIEERRAINACRAKARTAALASARAREEQALAQR